MNSSGEERERPGHRMGAMELLGACGYSFFFGWAFVTFFWLIHACPNTWTLGEQCIAQAFGFGGMVLGNLALSVLSRCGKNLSSTYLLIGCVIGSALFPAATLLACAGVPAPLPVFCLAALVSGLSYAFLNAAWLDACSRIRVGSHFSCVSASISLGSLWFLLAWFMPQILQPVTALVYLCVSTALQLFVDSTGSEKNWDPVAEPRTTYVKHARETEPSFFMYGIIFALVFVHLLRLDQESFFFGFVCVFIGAALVLVIDSLKKPVGITVMQRTLVCIMLAACLLLPFAPALVQIACTGLVLAGWGAFISINTASIVSILARKHLAVFPHAPALLVPSSAGFLVGWVAACTMVSFNVPQDVASGVILCSALVLVTVFMAFFPKSELDEFKKQEKASVTVASDLSETELFERRCAAVAELYHLSPRETEILGFLAKGRNAAYIQNKLTISPHTVKSHIYSIYRKTDIHSQQNLMDFVETYPVEQDQKQE